MSELLKRVAARQTTFYEDVDRALRDSGNQSFTHRGLTIARCLSTALFDLPAEYVPDFACTLLQDLPEAPTVVEATGPSPALLRLIEANEAQGTDADLSCDSSSDSEMIETAATEPVVRDLVLFEPDTVSEAVTCAPLAPYVTPGVTKVGPDFPLERN
jgi:hypothetical protein